MWQRIARRRGKGSDDGGTKVQRDEATQTVKSKIAHASKRDSKQPHDRMLQCFQDLASQSNSMHPNMPDCTTADCSWKEEQRMLT